MVMDRFRVPFRDVEITVGNVAGFIIGQGVREYSGDNLERIKDREKHKKNDRGGRFLEGVHFDILKGPGTKRKARNLEGIAPFIHRRSGFRRELGFEVRSSN
jgi:hypothetical protein